VWALLQASLVTGRCDGAGTVDWARYTVEIDHARVALLQAVPAPEPASSMFPEPTVDSPRVRQAVRDLAGELARVYLVASVDQRRRPSSRRWLREAATHLSRAAKHLASS